jgi:hypothetical protein
MKKQVTPCRRTLENRSGSPRRARTAQARLAPRILLLLLLPAALALQYFAARSPLTVERLYSRGFYRAVSGAVSGYFNLFPFSCAELILYAAVIFAVFLAALAVSCVFRRRVRALLRLLVTAGCVFTTGCFLLTLMWGLNYCRVPLGQSLAYKEGAPSEAELSAVMQSETDAVNALCGAVSYDKNGRSHYAGGFKKISAEVNSGYEALARESALQNGLFGAGRPRPKGIFASKLLSYTGIEGIFIPFTFEPNVDTDLPDFVQPFDAAHESAHFKGFAREDEANFCAYLADAANGDPYFKYSAHMEAYIYVSNALYATDSTAWGRIASKLDSRAAGDFRYYNAYVAAHKSRAADVSNKINDGYLKSQGQKGVVTYDMFVTLLTEKYRTENG